MRQNRCFVLYSLSAWTLPIFIFARLLYYDLYFVRCSKLIKKYFKSVVVKIGGEQLTEHDYYGTDNYVLSQNLSIKAGKKNRQINQNLANALSKYGGDTGYIEMLERAFSFGWYSHHFLIPFISSGLSDLSKKYNRVDFLSFVPSNVFHWPTEMSTIVNFVDWHRPLSTFFQSIFRAGFLFFLLIFPFINAALYLFKGFRPYFFKRKSFGVVKKNLFIHRHENLMDNAARDMFFFRSKILEISDYSHYLMATSANFGSIKSTYLRQLGGHITHTRDIWPPVFKFLDQVFYKYYCAMFPASFQIIFSQELNFQAFKQLLEILHLSQLASMLLDYCKPLTVCMEIEYNPIANIVAIEARKRNIPSISMIHGISAQRIVFANRARLQFKYLLTSGAVAQEVQKVMPRVKNFVSVGNHEAKPSLLNKTTKKKVEGRPDWLNQEPDLKVVGFYFALINGFIDKSSVHGETEYIDDEKCRAHAIRYLKPLFDWVANREDVIFVWKPKYSNTETNIEHPWIKPLIADIPKERIILRPSAEISEVIKYSDISVCQGASSVIAASMAMGVPAVTFDLLYGGWASKYHKLMSANSGKELCENIDLILEGGLPKYVFNNFNLDWNGSSRIDFKTYEKISKFFKQSL